MNNLQIRGAARRVKPARFAPTASQRAVLDFARDDWQRDQPLLVTGPAGTGKSSLLPHLAKSLGINPAFLAPTGKAAQVLRSKLGETAPFIGTIHSGLYAPVAKDPERYEELRTALARERSPRKIRQIRREMRALSSPSWMLQPDFIWQRRNWEGPRDINAIVVDEASMVGERIGSELVETAQRFGLTLIAVGDFYQLPPVAEAAYFSLDNCTVAPELDEIVRQQRGSPIIELASRIRRGGTLRRVDSDELVVFPRGAIDPWDFDIILVGSNRTRHRINEDFRDEQGFLDLPPQPGEPAILLRNDHALGICNGDIFEVQDCEFDDGAMWITGRFDDSRTLTFPAKIEDPVHGADMTGEAAPIAYAYTVTAHKAQGSEWGSVLVIDESEVFGRDAGRWLYTAATRAREHLTIVKRL